MRVCGSVCSCMYQFLILSMSRFWICDFVPLNETDLKITFKPVSYTTCISAWFSLRRSCLWFLMIFISLRSHRVFLFFLVLFSWFLFLFLEKYGCLSFLQDFLRFNFCFFEGLGCFLSVSTFLFFFFGFLKNLDAFSIFFLFSCIFCFFEKFQWLFFDSQL